MATGRQQRTSSTKSVADLMELCAEMRRTPGRFVDRRELVETAAAKLEVLDVDLDRLPRGRDLSAAPRPWAVSLQGHPGNAMLFEDPVDGGCRDVDLVVPLQEEANPERTVLVLATDLEDQGNDMRGVVNGW